MPFTVDSKIKDILAAPKARAAIDSVIPGLLNDPRLILIQGMTIRKAFALLPRFMPAILKKADAILAKVDETPQPYDFDEIIDRKHTNSLKYESGFADPDLPADHIPMWVADMDFACPQPILDAMKARINQRILGYAVMSEPEDYEPVAGWMRRRHNWDVDTAQICHTAGIMDGINACITHYTNKGEGVIFQTPCYLPFHETTQALARTPVHNPLRYDNGYFTIDFDDLAQKCADPNNTMLIFCNPHNPTGRVFTEQELRQIADLCIQNDVFIVSDEAHADIVRPDQKHMPVASLYPEEKRIITCTAPGKTFNIAGVKHANIICNDRAVAAQWRDGHYGAMPNPLSIAACNAAYTACDDWVNAMNAYVSNTFSWVTAYIEDHLPNICVAKPEGTYLLWLNLRAYGVSDAALKKAVSNGGLYLEYAHDFVANADGFVRLNLACPRAVVKAAMQKFSAALANL